MPSVQTRRTSSVLPSSSLRATGLPAIATPTSFPSTRSADGELAAHRGQVVPVVLGDELVGFSQVKWDRLHAGM